MKKIMAVVCCLYMGTAALGEDLKLWYSTPAQRWTEALPGREVGAVRQGRGQHARYDTWLLHTYTAKIDAA